MKRPKQKDFNNTSVPIGPPSDLSPHERIVWAMSQIEAEMKSPKGLFSPTGRGPSIQMVLWRAGYRKSYLERKGENTQRDASQAMIKSTIKGWLNRICGHPISRPEPIISRQRDALDDEDYMKQIHDAELQLVEANARIDELETKIASLQAPESHSNTEVSRDEWIEELVLRILDRVPSPNQPIKRKR